MAVAAFSRSRGVTGVRTTKGLLCIFTLLCLVYLTSSLTYEYKLEELKEIFQKLQKETDIMKAKHILDMVTTSQHMSAMDQKIALMTRVMKAALPDFTPVDICLQNVNSIMEKVKTNINKEEEKVDAMIEDNEEKLEEMSRLITFLEENQADL